MHRNRNNLKVAVNLDAYYYTVRFIAILPHMLQNWQNRPGNRLKGSTTLSFTWLNQSLIND